MGGRYGTINPRQKVGRMHHNKKRKKQTSEDDVKELSADDVAAYVTIKERDKNQNQQEGRMNNIKHLIRQLVAETLSEIDEASAFANEEMKDAEAEDTNKKKGKLSKPSDPVPDGKKGSFADIMAHRIEKSGVYASEKDIIKKAQSSAQNAKKKSQK